MDRVSADAYQVSRVTPPVGDPMVARAYRESWIVDAPAVERSADSVVVGGSLRFWRGRRPDTTMRLVVPLGADGAPGEAELTLTRTGETPSVYRLTRTDTAFRELVMEIDVCASVDAEPVLPRYDTGSIDDRPPDLSPRTLTIERAYEETGVRVRIADERTTVDDSAPGFERWSPAELHDAMETAFSQMTAEWPAWRMWGLLAGRFDNLEVGGLMFDTAAVWGGAGKPPDRQGFAVFRRHGWFGDLRPDAPPRYRLRAERQFLYTWVHEAGHAFNFLHSWDKGRPDALSWMNYPDRLQGFWGRFHMRFDDEELLHIRHGDRAAVIMGGDPWSFGSHAESEPPGDLEGEPALELLVRSPGRFGFMEPVVLELRLRNLLPDAPLEVDARLAPEHGLVAVHVRRPDGRTLRYRPLTCALSSPRPKTLLPHGSGPEGEDRHSERLFLGYGRGGFLFDDPGEYLVRAEYRSGELMATSNAHRLRIGHPASEEADRFAQDFFSYPVGMSLYLGGSASPHLAEGARALDEAVARFPGTLLGARCAATRARSVARPFYRLEDGALRRAQEGDPEEALRLTEPALALYRDAGVRALNLDYHALVRERAAQAVACGRPHQAAEELRTLREKLGERGVNPPVLEDIAAEEAALAQA